MVLSLLKWNPIATGVGGTVTLVNAEFAGINIIVQFSEDKIGTQTLDNVVGLGSTTTQTIRVGNLAGSTGVTINPGGSISA